MERASVLSPSISVAAHLAGAVALATAPLVLPQRLPDPATRSFVAGVHVDRMTVATLAGPGAAAPRRAPVRVSKPAPVPSRFAWVPEAPQPIAEDALPQAAIDGWPDDAVSDGHGAGLCLIDCGEGSTSAGGDGQWKPSRRESAAPQRVRAGGVVREPRKLRHVAPVYPPLAVAARVQATVILECVIDADGRVSSVEVLRGHPLLDQAAVDAVRQWRYTPTLLNGTRVSVLLTVTVDFRLR